MNVINTAAFSTFVFVSTNNSLISRLIRRITKSDWSHMGIGFALSDGRKVYYECLFSDGFQGPKDFNKLRAWQRKSKGNKLEMRFLPLSPDDSDRKQFLCEARKGLIGYAALQLIAMWYFERIGKYFGAQVPESPRRMVCSEAVASILQPDLDLRDPVHNTWDSVNPGSAWIRVQEITAHDALKTVGAAGGINPATTPVSPICTQPDENAAYSRRGEAHLALHNNQKESP